MKELLSDKNDLHKFLDFEKTGHTKFKQTSAIKIKQSILGYEKIVPVSPPKDIKIINSN